ncbi:MAG: tetratricopeptide repeat protein [Paludibacter sp.]|nr:tetratricopeptide repeat protein [Paludibacter sp.]
MHFKISIFILFFSLFITGCSFVPNELKTAERIMDAHPDSALSILQHLKTKNYKSHSDQALYGLLLFQALDQNNKPFLSDSLIDFSISYYQIQNDKRHLATCYYYKGHTAKYSQHFDEAASFYIKALECLQNNTDDKLMGKIYTDMGDICSFQQDYKEARKKYIKSLEYFKKSGRTIDSKFVILSIGRTYHFLKDYKTAQRYYLEALPQISDSMVYGAVYQELGTNYYSSKQFDSAEYYLRKSLNYPYKGTSYSIRCYALADLLFDKDQIDSSKQYALLGLRYPATFFTRREYYRILTNIEYSRKNFNQMKLYMTYYQDYTDSIHKIELQTKSTVLENFHTTTQEASMTKKSMILIVSILLIVLLLSVYLVFYLFKRNKLKREQLNAFKQQLNIKQEFVNQGLIHKIEETKALKAEERKNASVDERANLDKELYNIALHLNNWDVFSGEMNHAFNNIIVSLKSVYPAITRKEKIWCCLHLLDVPHADRMLLLEATSDSLYKLKQRLAHKLNLKSTKELDLYLKNLTEIKD